MNQREFRELSAGHALGALASDEERAFAAALAEHPQWQWIVDEDLAAASGLGRSVPEIPPPAALREQILGSIIGVPQRDPVHNAPTQAEASIAATHEVPSSTSAEPAHALDTFTSAETPEPRQTSRTWRIGFFALAASVVLLSTVMFGPRIIASFAPQDPAVVALQQVEDAPDADSSSLELPGGATATLHWSDVTGQAVLVADGMAPAEAGTDFELWLVRGQEAISVGLMRPDEDEHGIFVTDRFVAGDTLAVTVEQAGGSKSGAPTSDPILAIATA